ncbi:zinc finger MYM-type protein 1-like [Helianthus annuus]|uniref:zinc finger MYM-type protein 1-like n=1 Tax=Helianthus annuus TaxID=4232 RepID=UPI001652C92F|nr:zinc finger MYM-type protein 1-like [Helianthus annuus]
MRHSNRLSKQLKDNQITYNDQKTLCITIPIQETLHLPPASLLRLRPPTAGSSFFPPLRRPIRLHWPNCLRNFVAYHLGQIMQESLKRKFHVSSSSSNNRMRIDLEDLPWDPAERKPILSYDVNQRDEIRRAYLNKGPCQPQGHVFPKRDIGGRMRQFNPDWFKEFGCWLEYSVKLDAVFCLVCYLFKESGQKDAFVTDGYNGWNKKDRLGIHVGVPFNLSQKHKIEYRIRLSTSVILAKALLNGALPFRGHDESESSSYKGHFLEFLKLLGELNESIGKVILGNAPGNNQMTSPKIQKDICNCFAQEVLKQIFEELADDVFSILVDESRDISKKEQMAVVLRYVDKHGVIKERFIGLVHVMETSALSLKSGIDDLFSRYNLSLARVRGQGYDGASNMAVISNNY